MKQYQQWLAEVGRQLRTIRETRGYRMTVAVAIRKKYGVKVDAGYLSRMERGKAEIPLRTLYALTDFYGVQLSQVIPGTGRNDFEAGALMILDDPDIPSLLAQISKALGMEKTRRHIREWLITNLELIGD